MLQLLHGEPTFSDRFISYMLARNLRIEADARLVGSHMGIRSARERPLAKRCPQLVRLLLQLPHPLHLHRQVATDLLDLAFEGIWQFRQCGRSSCPTHAT